MKIFPWQKRNFNRRYPKDYGFIRTLYITWFLYFVVWLAKFFCYGAKTFDEVKGGFESIAKLAKLDIVPIAICNFIGYNIIPFREHLVLKIGKSISYQLPEDEILKQWKEYMETNMEYRE